MMTPPPKPLVRDPDQIRLAMLGMVEGNGHPYSWSAIINGDYDADGMSRCGYPVISRYLDAQPRDSLGIAGVKVTHVWCDDSDDAQRVAQTCGVPEIVGRPEEVIGEVDAVVIPTDIGHEHLERARPFIDAGLPVFIDKPLTDRADHLARFIDWQRSGKALLSSSCMRYAREFAALRTQLKPVGRPRLVSVTMPKSWARYGIHAVEAAYPFVSLGGWRSVRHSGDDRVAMVHARHADGIEIMFMVIHDLYGGFGHVSVTGTEGCAHAAFEDTFYAFKAQLQAFVDYLRTGRSPIAFDETVEQMNIIIAGLRSREESGRVVDLAEIGPGPNA